MLQNAVFNSADQPEPIGIKIRGLDSRDLRMLCSHFQAEASASSNAQLGLPAEFLIGQCSCLPRLARHRPVRRSTME
jgi:hypothetical protein